MLIIVVEKPYERQKLYFFFYHRLVFAYKKLSKEEYSQWLVYSIKTHIPQEVVESSGYSSNTLPLSLQERIEKDMNLQGAVAIQDDLVHDVYYSIKRLQAAGIRFWILTGDKADTAEAIAVIIQ